MRVLLGCGDEGEIHSLLKKDKKLGKDAGNSSSQDTEWYWPQFKFLNFVLFCIRATLNCGLDSVLMGHFRQFLGNYMWC